MQESLTVIGIILIGMALRSCRKRLFRKLGALVYLLASGVIVYFLTANLLLSIASIFLWFLLPWIELGSRVRKLRLPLKNHLHEEGRPRLQHFPEAAHNIDELEALDFEHSSDYSWDWAGSSQHYSFYWHPEERAVVTICLCKQSNIAFSYLTISSRCKDGKVYRTSNFPFSPTLKNAPHVSWNQLTCRHCTLEDSLNNHRRFIQKKGTDFDALMMPDPDALNEEVENDMATQIQHNLDSGIITLSENGKFRYSFRGLCFLWRQFIKDMIRLS
ncbi:hypothetical protein [Rubritalea tangerina]|uniref:Uncharacterized protein n=1 Tax=Rubritalea tangerina TaxID=430798 RepID=A0ABW4Z785_9BACT